MSYKGIENNREVIVNTIMDHRALNTELFHSLHSMKDVISEFQRKAEQLPIQKKHTSYKQDLVYLSDEISDLLESCFSLYRAKADKRERQTKQVL